MKKWSSLLIILLTACSVEYPTDTPGPPVIGDEQEVVIKITFPGSEQVKTKAPSTYAIEETEENTVNTLDIFAFVSGGDGVDASNDIFMYRVTVPKSKIIDDAPSLGVIKNVVTSLKRLPQKQRFIFVANIPPAITLNLAEGVTTQQEIVDQLKFNALSWRSVQTSSNYTPIPMWGQKKDSMMINSASSLDLGKIYLVRSMARIDVAVAPGLSDFTIKNIHVCNISESGYIAPNKNEWDARIITKPNTLPNRIDVPAPYPFPAGNALERTIYMPETDSLIINGVDSVKPAYIVIHAEYKNSDNYYRIDFVKNGKFHPLLRNHAYTIKVIGVKDGYQSLAEAKNAPVSNLNFSLTLEDENSNINDVVYLENQYMLGVSGSEVLFDWDMPWIGKPLTGAEATDYFPLSVYTNYQSGWTASLSIPDGGNWVTLDGATSGQKDTPGGVKIRVTGENITGAERNAKLIIRAGMLTKEVNIRQSGGSNSRLIRFGTAATATTKIPLAFADKARGGNLFAGLSVSDIEAKVIWEETGIGQPTFTTAIEGTGTLTKDRHIKVTATAGTTKYGNALIAIVRKGSAVSMVGGIDNDEILWSWHIWSMPVSDDMDESYHNPNKPTFMKKVLGKYDDNKGMFYQWGRKDPFPQQLADVMPQAIKNKPVEEANNIANSIKNPATFYHKGTTYQFWVGDLSHINGLWGTDKTYYDPCPVGWKVPQNGKKAQWTSSIPAINFLNGNLSNETGLWQAGSPYKGMVWTVNVSGTSANTWGILNDGITLDNSTSGFSFGYSVRCIKDIQLIKTKL